MTTSRISSAVAPPHVWTIDVEAFDTEPHLHGVYLSAHAADLAVIDLVTTRFTGEWSEHNTPMPDRSDFLNLRDWQRAVLDAWDALLTSAIVSVTEHAPHGVPTPPAHFEYSPWRHGGWYVNNVRYPGGGVGCVSRNYPDRQWRIACDPRPFETQPTFASRDAAALAEWRLIHGLDRIPTP